MKTLFIILFLLAGIVSSNAYAGNNNNDPQTQEEKKTAKPKYDFNIFKFFSVPLQQQTSDSLKTAPQTKNKSIFITNRNTLYYTSKKKS